MQRTLEVKVRLDTPRGWSLVGALLGAGVGALLMKKAFEYREDRALRHHPILLSLGSVALGMFAALLLPVSHRERQLLEPARRSMEDSDTLEHAERLMGADRPGLELSDRSESLATPTGSRIPPMPPLDDLSTKLH